MNGVNRLGVVYRAFRLVDQISADRLEISAVTPINTEPSIIITTLPIYSGSQYSPIWHNVGQHNFFAAGAKQLRSTRAERLRQAVHSVTFQVFRHS